MPPRVVLPVGLRNALWRLRYAANRLWRHPWTDCGDHHSTLFVAGVGRSGTTWLSDILNFNNQYRLMFEPFHAEKVSVCRRFRIRQYLRPANTDPYFLNAANTILDGRVRNAWIDSQNRKHFSRRRIIKDIRANLLLGWLHAHFPNLPIVYVLRHPCAVAISRCRMNFATHFDDFLAQEDLIDDFLHPFVGTLTRTEGDFQKQILLWCVENYVVFRQCKPGALHIMFYEDLCVDPRREIDALFHFLRQEVPERVFAQLDRPSALSRQGSAIITGDSLIDGWRKAVSREELVQAMDLVAMFGLDRIYTDRSLPNTQDVLELLVEE